MFLGQTDVSRWKYKYIFTGTLQGCAVCILPKGLSTVFCVQERSFNCPPHYIIIWERGDRGFSICDVASLMMCSIDAPKTIVTKSLYSSRIHQS